MRAETAAAYCDEKSVESFRKSVGTLYPLPHRISGKGDRWLREELDITLDNLLDGKAINDAAEVL
jgi:hypothetical protein